MQNVIPKISWSYYYAIHYKAALVIMIPILVIIIHYYHVQEPHTQDDNVRVSLAVLSENSK